MLRLDEFDRLRQRIVGVPALVASDFGVLAVPDEGISVAEGQWLNAESRSQKWVRHFLRISFQTWVVNAVDRGLIVQLWC